MWVQASEKATILYPRFHSTSSGKKLEAKVVKIKRQQCTNTEHGHNRHVEDIPWATFEPSRGEYRESLMPAAAGGGKARCRAHTTAALGNNRVSSDGQYELTELTPCYCKDTTMHMACRRTEKEKEKEPLTWFFWGAFFPPYTKIQSLFQWWLKELTGIQVIKCLHETLNIH